MNELRKVILPRDYFFTAGDEVLIRRQRVGDPFPVDDWGDEDITEQMPTLENGQRFMHPGTPSDPPIILRDGERMLLRRYADRVDLILVR